MSTTPRFAIPKYGWKVKLNHIFPEKWDQNFVPSLRIILSLLTLIIRYVSYELWCYVRRKKPVMDYIKLVNPDKIYGVPLGGIGGGTISRSFQGEFCRFQLKPGIYEYDVVFTDQFIVTVRNEKNITIYQNVLSVNSAPKSGHLNTWKWKFPGDHVEYTALYPRSWTEYFIAECNIKLICKQISPVIPHNYKDSSIPGGVFIWSIENNDSQPLTVAITMCFKGYKGSSSGSPFEVDNGDVKVCGVNILSSVNSMKCTFAFGAKENGNVSVTSTSFSPIGSGATVWDQLRDRGEFNGKLDSFVREEFFGEIACAVSAKTLVQSGGSEILEFALVWHMPYICFHNRQRKYKRYYTKYFGIEDNASANMCHYAITHYNEWEQAIEQWQEPVLNNSSLPDWYKSAIFNELYFISDGGTLWLLLDEKEIQNLPMTDIRRNYGQFAYLEGHEYRMYNTYDVHFYASFALVDLWPKLQLTIQYEVRDAISKKDMSFRWFLYNGHFGHRKEAHCVPHDIGDPEDEPFLKLNGYPVHDVTQWKDLNLKFVLMCYRDYMLIKDENYLKDMWPQIKILMDYCLEWDVDQDGMIENSGFPDQTYDCWTMSGVSAYCGSLWLGALYVTVKMAAILGDEETIKRFSKTLTQAKNIFTKKLWNGSYYDFDSDSSNSKSIMADQLCGIWYLFASGVTEDILPIENVRQTLSTVFEFNVKRFCNGQRGAVNGMLPNGEIDKSSVQSQEVWIGVTYGLASHFIHHGMEDEGFATARGVYDTVYNKIGLGFNTPEALYEKDHFRSVGYMRPLSIWSMQMALQKVHKA